MSYKKKVDISELYDCLKERRNCYFVGVDIKSLVPINNISHKAGDIAILTALRRLENACGENDIVFRIGGDEFCVILNKKSFKSDEDIIRICQKFQKMLEELRLHEPLLPNVSFGHKVFDGNQKYLKQNIEEADAMMYKIKQEHHSRMQG